MQRRVEVSKEGAKRAAFVLCLSVLLSDPCGGDAARGQSQQLLAPVAWKGPREDPRGWLGLGELNMSFPGAFCASRCRTVAMTWVFKSKSAVFRWQLGFLAAP